MGGGREYRIRTQNSPRKVEDVTQSLAYFLFSLLCVVCYIFDFSGGILGSDAVLTTCILCEKVITPRPTIEMNEGTRIPSSGRSREELRSNLLEASHLTPPHTKFHTISLKTFFFHKIIILIRYKQNSLSKHS